MNRETALNLIRQAAPALRARGVASAGLFGSFARHEAHAASDIDIAVRPADGYTISPRDLLSLYGILGATFGFETPIDVVVLPATDADLNEAILKEQVIAF